MRITMKSNSFKIIINVLITVFIYSGFVTLIETIKRTIDMLTNINDLAIILALGALIAIVSSALVFHFLKKIKNSGWKSLVLITAILGGGGTLLFQVSALATILSAAALPGLLYLIDPRTSREWCEQVFHLSTEPRLPISTGFLGVILFLQGITFSIAKNDWLFLMFAILFIIIGISGIMLPSTPRDEQDIPKNQKQAIKFKEATPLQKILSITFAIGGQLHVLILITVVKLLSAFSSYDSVLSPISATVLLLIASYAGSIMFYIIAFTFKQRSKTKLIFVISALVIAMLSITFLMKMFTILQGELNLILRIVLSISLPVSAGFILFAGIPNVKAPGLNFFRGFITMISAIILIIGIIDIGADVNNIVYYVLIFGFSMALLSLILFGIYLSKQNTSHANIKNEIKIDN
ncbi:MAG: hypothetical protein ACTSVI_00080 [Promethearchaeota archaeon]